ncbi:phage antirepressor KilAC domain-containing protein [uncultured Ruegeria sp.]|uniref:phage antirepressor KilAC domain-containing protein n=1 Tax=uncultured Ruegeria sp. TaxID=259304 RepID=UPI002620609B|nr:phage antirepressor KilAC domain-containing protein [uncultured Ruegeria sp.]
MENLPIKVEEFNGEHRVRDLQLAEALGFAQRRDIRKLIDRHKAALSEFGEVSRHRGTKPPKGSSGGRPQEYYYLNEEQAVYICTKSDTPKATEVSIEVVKTFVAVTRGHSPAPALPDYSDPQVVLGVISHLKEEADTAKAKVIELAPKAEGFDHLMNADGLYGLQNAARALGARPNLFTRWLKQVYLFYQGGALVPRVQYTQRGLFEVKTTIVEDKARPRTFVTPKGLDFFRDKVPANLLIGGAA